MVRDEGGVLVVTTESLRLNTGVKLAIGNMNSLGQESIWIAQSAHMGDRITPSSSKDIQHRPWTGSSLHGLRCNAGSVLLLEAILFLTTF